MPPSNVGSAKASRLSVENRDSKMNPTKTNVVIHSTENTPILNKMRDDELVQPPEAQNKDIEHELMLSLR